MQENGTNRIKIGQLVWELRHFKDKWLNHGGSFFCVCSTTFSIGGCAAIGKIYSMALKLCKSYFLDE